MACTRACCSAYTGHLQERVALRPYMYIRGDRFWPPSGTVAFRALIIPPMYVTDALVLLQTDFMYKKGVKTEAVQSRVLWTYGQWYISHPGAKVVGEFCWENNLRRLSIPPWYIEISSQGAYPVCRMTYASPSPASRSLCLISLSLPSMALSGTTQSWWRGPTIRVGTLIRPQHLAHVFAGCSLSPGWRTPRR